MVKSALKKPPKSALKKRPPPTTNPTVSQRWMQEESELEDVNYTIESFSAIKDKLENGEYISEKLASF